MGAVVCRSASPQDSRRDTEAMRRSLFGESFQGRECDCDTLFCLACEYRGQFSKSRADSEDSSTSENDERLWQDKHTDSDLKASHFLQIKQRFRSSSGKINSLQSTSCFSVSCPETSTIRPETGIIKLKNLKPLPQKYVSYRIFSTLQTIGPDEARPKKCQL